MLFCTFHYHHSKGNCIKQSPGMEESDDKKRRSGRNKRDKIVDPAGAPPLPYDYRRDPNETYIEDEAHLYHNPPLPSKESGGVTGEELRRIPPPPDVPKSILPNTGGCEWSWDDKTRVLHADFSDSKRMDIVDERFLFRMMERDDVTVISTGLVSPKGLDSSTWSLQYLKNVLDSQYIHKIRRYEVTENGMCVECDNMRSMTAKDYHEYVQKREMVLQNIDTDNIMHYVDHEGLEHSFDVAKTILYVLDLDLGELLPALSTDFKKHVRLPGVLPGGLHCMMSAVRNEQKYRTVQCQSTDLTD